MYSCKGALSACLLAASGANATESILLNPPAEVTILTREKNPREHLHLGRIPPLFAIPFSIEIASLGEDGEFWESHESSCGCTAADFTPQFLAAGLPLKITGLFTAQARSDTGPQHQTLLFKSNLRTVTVHISAEVIGHNARQLPTIAVNTADTPAFPSVNLDPDRIYTAFFSDSLRRRGIWLDKNAHLRIRNNATDYFPPPVYPQTVTGHIALVATHDSPGIATMFSVPVKIKTTGTLKTDRSIIDFGFVDEKASTKKTFTVSGPEELLATLSLEPPPHIQGKINPLKAYQREITLTIDAKQYTGAGFHQAELLLHTFAEAYKIQISFAE